MKCSAEKVLYKIGKLSHYLNVGETSLWRRNSLIIYSKYKRTMQSGEQERVSHIHCSNL